MEEVLAEETKKAPSGAAKPEAIAIGVDIGHSAVKLAWNKGEGVEKLIFPSAVIPAVSISDTETARRAAAETVLMQGKRYFYGDTAIIQAGASAPTGLVSSWVQTPEYRVLLCAAADRLERAGVSLNGAILVSGLPSSLVASQAEGLRELMKAIFPQADVKVHQQPMGAYAAHRFSEKGLPSRNIGEGEAWAVVDVGRFSTDFLLVTGGNVVERVTHSTAGTRLVAEKLRNVVKSKFDVDDLSPAEAEEIIVTGTMMSYGKRLRVAEEIGEAVQQSAVDLLDTAGRLLGQDARRLAGVLVAGGGAQLFFDRIKEIFPQAILLNEPRFAVAEGFRRIGAGILLARRMK